MTTPADWYQDPEGAPGDLRYWDGTQWTEHRAPADRGATPSATVQKADWYPDPEGAPGDLRYWDGTQWTEHRAPSSAPAAAPPPPVAAPPPPVAAPPPPAAAPPPPVAAPPAPEPPAAAAPPAAPSPPAEPPTPATPPTIVPGVAAGMAVGAAASSPPTPPTPPSPPSPPAAGGPGGAPPAPPKRSRAPLFIGLAVLVVLLVVGGIVAALALGGGSSKKSPSEWASAFCKNTKVVEAARAAETAQQAIAGEDLDALADWLDTVVAFFDTAAATISSLGAPDIPGGEAVASEVPTAMRDATATVESIAEDLRDGSTRSLQRFSESDWDPLDSMSTQAKSAWEQIQAQFRSQDACAPIDNALNNE